MISTPDILGPLLNHGDSFVIIQNGVGVEGELRRQLPAATIISCCTWVGTAIVENGRLLTQYGIVGISSPWRSSCLTELQEHIALGIYPPPGGKPEEESLKLMTDLLLNGGVRPEPEPDIVAQRWRKLMW